MNKNERMQMGSHAEAANFLAADRLRIWQGEQPIYDKSSMSISEARAVILDRTTHDLIIAPDDLTPHHEMMLDVKKNGHLAKFVEGELLNVTSTPENHGPQVIFLRDDTYPLSYEEIETLEGKHDIHLVPASQLKSKD